MRRVIFSFIFFLIFLTLAYAQLQVFCEAGGPYVVGANVNVVGNISLNGEGVIANVSVKLISGNSILKEINTTSDLKGFYSVNFSSVDYGNYKINVTAEKNGEKGYCQDTLSVTVKQPEITCQNGTIKIKGRIFDKNGTLTTAKIKYYIKELDFVNETTANPNFELIANDCFIIGKKYLLEGIIYSGNKKGYFAIYVSFSG